MKWRAFNIYFCLCSSFNKSKLDVQSQWNTKEHLARKQCSVKRAGNHKHLWKCIHRAKSTCNTVSPHAGTTIQTENYSQCSGLQEYIAPCPLCGASKHRDLLWPSAPDVWQLPQPSSAGEKETALLGSKKGHREFKMQDSREDPTDPLPLPERLKYW